MNLAGCVGKRPPLIDANVYAALILQEHRGHGVAHGCWPRRAPLHILSLVELAVIRLLLRPLTAGGCGLSAARARS